MPADALWTLAMACNVYLTFFRKYDAQQLRALEWKYLIFCYGLPCIPAFAYFFVQSPARGKVYGSATVRLTVQIPLSSGCLHYSQLWCWVSADWDFLRVATFYGPIWVVISITFTVYLWAGKEIFARRRQLRNFANAASDAAFPVIQNPFISPFVSVRTTEIRVTSELADLAGKNGSNHSFALNESGRIISTQSFDPYSISIAAGPTTDMSSPRSSTLPRSSASMGFGADKDARRLKAAMEANKAAFSYCKCALLFFASLLITWVPSSVNRVYSLVHPDTQLFPLLLASAVVLPLQGFWNALIYIATSLPACKALFSQIVDYWAPERKIKSSSPYPPSITSKGSIGSTANSMKTFPYVGLREVS